MNYCDENGCMNRKRNLVEEPIEMKNIHVLPTDNYSPLVHSTNKYGGYFKSEHYSPMKEMGDSYQNIYITSDEEIKFNEYVIQVNFEKTNTQVIRCTTEFQVKIANDEDGSFTKKKIILTTDQDLIKDGVQAIDDEFLEWFVKNPSCEEVPIIPKLFGHPYIIWIEGLSLKEAAENYVRNEPDATLKLISKYSFKDGAKWQAERMYSEEEVFNLCREFAIFVQRNGPSYKKQQEWFEQFKRKA